MKLRKVDFYLDWPRSIQAINLRKFIMRDLIKKGRVIRWAIVEIKDSLDSPNIKIMRINAVIANSTNS